MWRFISITSPHQRSVVSSTTLRQPWLWLPSIAVALAVAFAFFAIQQASAQDDAPPAITSASIHENTLQVGYDRALDEDQVPPLNAYVIRINKQRTTTTSVAVSGQRVTLTLDQSAEDDDLVRLTYRHKAKPTLRSEAGVNAETVRKVPVTVLTVEVVEPTPTPTPDSAEQASGQAADDFIPRNFNYNLLVNGVRFTWAAPSSGTVKQYQLRWDDDSGLEDGETIVTVDGDASHLRADARPGAGTQVWAQVRAQDDSDDTWGPWSYVLYGTGNANDDREEPDAPAAPTVTPGDGTLTVTWAAPADHGNSIVRYSVEHRQGDSGNWTEVRAAWRIRDGGDLSYTIRNQTNGTSYQTRVLATSAVGNSDWSASTSATPTDGTPPDPTATIAAGTSPITEGGDAVFTVTLNPAPSSNLDVNYNVTVSGDYGVSAASDQSVTVGTTGTATITLTTTNDDVDEANGSVTVTLATGTGYTVGTANSASVTVNDNDDAPAIDYDSDNDGFIEVDSLAKLNAIRWDKDGNGNVDDDEDETAVNGYDAAFPNAMVNLGCSYCDGYELTADLGFDENGDGNITSADATYWNGGEGWRPIGGLENAGSNTGFKASFRGNGHTISNLFIDRRGEGPATEWAGYRVGLFGIAASTSDIRNLTLADVDVTGDEEVGALVGLALGEVYNVSVTGSVTGNVIDTGGVVGFLLRGLIFSSSFDGTVSGTSSYVGGLAGSLTGGAVRYSSASGTVNPTGGYASRVGGLVGSNTGIIYASYADNDVTANDSLWVGGLVGQNGGQFARDSGTIVASYSRGDVSGKGDVGGLVGENYATILISYSTGAVHKRGGQYATAGGLVGWQHESRYNHIGESFWSSDDTGQTFGVGSDDWNNNDRVDEGENNTVAGNTNSQLRTPTGYTGLYVNWDNFDEDGNAGTHQPWCFGNSNQLPTLKNAAGTCP